MKAEMMSRGFRLLALSAMLIGSLALNGWGRQDGDVRKFMRQKLESSQKVLEGLTREDYALIAKNARAMRELSEDAQWQRSPNINYIRLSTEFQDLADELDRKAKARNLDGATLAYLKLTMNCIECHKLVRDERLISLKGTGEDLSRDSVPAIK